jgi:hypothetical protein
MSMLITMLGATVAVAAAVRSTWSPCGLSMLSTITPFGERSRGHRYPVTVIWFVAGSILGGATLGALAAGLAGLAAAAGLGTHPGWVVSVAAVAAVAAAGVDAGWFGDLIPLWRRQVNDGWLARYRSWVYATGFGWQIGVGVATYIMTAGVFLVVVLAAVTANPVAAVAICTGFGLVRGLAVILTARADSPARLRDMHARFDRVGPAVRVAVILVELAVAVTVLGAQWSLAGWFIGFVLVAATVAVGMVAAGERRAGVSPRPARGTPRLAGGSPGPETGLRPARAGPRRAE